MGPRDVPQGFDTRERVGRGSYQIEAGYCVVLIPVAARIVAMEETEGHVGGEFPGAEGLHEHSSAVDVQPPISFQVFCKVTSCENWPWRL